MERGKLLLNLPHYIFPLIFYISLIVKAGEPLQNKPPQSENNFLCYSQLYIESQFIMYYYYIPMDGGNYI